MIAQLLSAAESPERACQLLIDEANRQGGEDNITVVVACFRACDEPTKLADDDERTIITP
jgi:serine/threonine protein phosphatase PrpC